MSIIEKKITVFQIEGLAGSYTSREEAELVYAQNQLEKWAKSVSLCSGGEWSADMVVAAMVEDAGILSYILQKIAKGTA